MRVIIGAYRGLTLVRRALDSLAEYSTGVESVTVVDDSGHAVTRAALASMPGVDHVVPVAHGNAGYSEAMQVICETAGNSQFAFIEEDFELTAAVDFDELGSMLRARPHLAQIALLRGPHFPIEFEHGGLLEALEARLPGSVLGEVDGIIEQVGTFTCNVAVWADEIAAQGWPQVTWSEDAKRDELLAQGYRFGYLPGVRTRHDGERSGHGY